MAPGMEAHASMPLYVISVAAELSGLHPQTLRQYDRLGLVSPGRSPGRGRRYSAEDIATLREVQRLTAEGVNLAGVKRILELEAAVRRLHERLRALQPDSPAATKVGAEREPAARTPNLPVPLPARGSTALVVWRSRR